MTDLTAVLIGAALWVVILTIAALVMRAGRPSSLPRDSFDRLDGRLPR